MIEAIEKEITIIRAIRKWLDSEGGTFDYDGAVSLLKGYDAEIQKQHDEELMKLRHFRDATVGLWATDRPDLVSDPDNVLFRI